MSDRPLARVEGIVSESVGEDLVIYDGHTQTAHALSAAAATVWGLCDGQRTPDQIADELGLKLMMVTQALVELSDCGLLADVSLDGVSRRTALGRIAKVGGAAVIAAPLISTVLIPPATAAASTCGNACSIVYYSANGTCSEVAEKSGCAEVCNCHGNGICVPAGAYPSHDTESGTCVAY